MGEFTSTYDASHKVTGGGGHVKGFARHIGREADEQAGFRFKHSNPNITSERTALNQTMVNDGAGDFRSLVSVDGKPPSDELEGYLNTRLATVKKPLRKDAVLMRPMILQLDPKWFDQNNADWRENGINDLAGKYIGAQLDWACDEFGEKNIVGYSLHLDEAQPQLQVLFTPVTDDGRLSQKDFFKGPGDFKRQRADLNQRLEAEGYDVDHKVSTRSKEHLSSAEFQARADRVAERLEDLEGEIGAYETMKQSLVNRGAGLDERSAILDTKAADVAARELAAAQLASQAAAESEAAQRALESARASQIDAQRREHEASAAIDSYEVGLQLVMDAGDAARSLMNELRDLKVKGTARTRAVMDANGQTFRDVVAWDKNQRPAVTPYDGLG